MKKIMVIGGVSVLQTAKAGFPYLGGNIITSFSLPSFYDNFLESRIKNNELNSDLNQKIKLFQDSI